MTLHNRKMYWLATIEAKVQSQTGGASKRVNLKALLLYYSTLLHMGARMVHDTKNRWVSGTPLRSVPREIQPPPSRLTRNGTVLGQTPPPKCTGASPQDPTRGTC